MPRRASIIRPVPLHTTIPEDLMSKLQLQLFSEVEGKVPAGAIQKFLIERIREYFDSHSLDIGNYTNTAPKNTYIIRSSRQNIEQLKLLLGD